MRVEPTDGSPFWLFADMPRHYPLGQIPAIRFGAGGRFVKSGRSFTMPSQDPRGRVGAINRLETRFQQFQRRRRHLTVRRCFARSFARPFGFHSMRMP